MSAGRATEWFLRVHAYHEPGWNDPEGSRPRHWTDYLAKTFPTRELADQAAAATAARFAGSPDFISVEVVERPVPRKGPMDPQAEADLDRLVKRKESGRMAAKTFGGPHVLDDIEIHRQRLIEQHGVGYDR